MLSALQWERMTKKEIKKALDDFFEGKGHTASDPQEEKCFDYSFFYTVKKENYLVDIEIYYLKTRDKKCFITGTELLTYIEEKF